jgi:hypothetical protein
VPANTYLFRVTLNNTVLNVGEGRAMSVMSTVVKASSLRPRVANVSTS